MVFNSSLGDMSLPDLAALLSQLPSVESLRFDGDIGAIDIILDTLSRPLESKNGRVDWPCPRLHTLRLIDCKYSDSILLLRLVQRRSAATSRIASIPDATSLVPLRALMVGGRSEMVQWTYDALVDILGEAMRWDGRRISYYDSSLDDCLSSKDEETEESGQDFENGSDV